MWPWFAVAPLRAVELWPVLPLGFRITLDLGTWIYPCYTRMAMECSHAVHLTMNINMTFVGRILFASSCAGDAAHELADLRSGGEKKYRQQRESDTDHDPVPQPDREWGVRRRIVCSRQVSCHSPVIIFVRQCHEARFLPYRVFIFIHIFSGPS